MLHLMNKCVWIGWEVNRMITVNRLSWGRMREKDIKRLRQEVRERKISEFRERGISVNKKRAGE